MKNSKLSNLVLLVIVSLSIVLFAKNVLAATDFTSIALDSNNATSSTSSTSTSTSNTGNSTKPETVISSSKNSTTNNTVLKTNNTTSTYSNTTLPKTGAEDSMPGIILAIVLGVSAVYAYKKVQDYKNI